MSAAKPLDADAAKLLRLLMSEISEDHYCAGWLIGLEFTLWRIVLGGIPHFGFDFVSPDRIAELKRLSEKCGGWFMCSYETGETFVPMAEWLRIYEAEAAEKDTEAENPGSSAGSSKEEVGGNVSEEKKIWELPEEDFARLTDKGSDVRVLAWHLKSAMSLLEMAKGALTETLRRDFIAAAWHHESSALHIAAKKHRSSEVQEFIDAMKEHKKEKDTKPEGGGL